MSSLSTVLLALLLTGQPVVAERDSPWTPVPTPNPSMATNRLLGTTSIGDRAAWSVGTWQDNLTGRQRSLIQRWDGATWQNVDAPATRTGHDSLTAIAGSGPADLWAVGFTARSKHDPDKPADPDQGRPLIMRSDGITWAFEDLDPVGVSGHLSAVDMISADDGWAVGSYVPQEGAVPQGLILRRTGAGWQHVPPPDLGSRPVHLTGLTGTRTDDVWAVGYLGTLGSAAEAVVLHWNGEKWQQSPLDIDPGVQSALFSVSARAPGDVWAVGYTWAAGKRTGFALHHTAGRWQQVSVRVDEQGTQLRSVVAVPAGVWAVGYYLVDGVDNALVMTYDNTGFVKEAPPSPPEALNVAGTAMAGITATPGTGGLWAIGCHGDRTRVLHRDTGVR